jgi:hypothetical protein
MIFHKYLILTPRQPAQKIAPHGCKDTPFAAMKYASARLSVDARLMRFNTIKPGWRNRHR